MEKKIRLPLRSKLLVAFIVIATIPVLFLGFRSVIEIREAITENILQQNYEIANIVAQELSQTVKNAQTILETSIRNPDVKKMNIPTATFTLKSLVENFGIFEEIYLIPMDFEGLSILKAPGGLTIPTRNRDKLESVAQIWKMVFLFGGIHGYVSPVYFSHKEKNYPYLYMGFQIRNELFNTVGVLIAKLDLREIWPIVNRIRIGKTGFAHVVDENYRMLAHSNKDEVIGRLASENPVVHKALSGNKGTEEVVISETMHLSAYAPLKEYYSSRELKRYLEVNWGVIVQQDSKEAYEKVVQMTHRVFFLLILSVISAGIVGMYLAHSFTVPLKMLVVGAQNIARGDLTTHLEVSSTDEIGELTGQFDKMRNELRKKIDEMEILIEVSKDISSVLDYRQTLTRILDKNIQVLDADTGSIMLFDDDTGDLTIEASYGLPPEVVRQTRVTPGEGIVGWVVRIRKELIIYDTRKEPGFAELKGRAVEAGCLMSAPLIAKDKILGVINVRKKNPNSFDEKDLALFRALCIHAAIAIDNAKLYRQAVTDPMTKLYNHGYFQNRMDTEIEKARVKNSVFSLIITDIDHFKKFNDTYGHQTGDAVLKTVAKIMLDSVREFDVACRYGGEEFAVICPGVTKGEAVIPAERMRTSIQNHEFFVSGERVPITISLGISEFGTDATQKKHLIECADRALYNAKETGRNRCIVFSQDLFAENETKNEA
ncbi:MAG: diguanylate cyclase [Candidatus Wallbacteria bacterium]|nr:diguanylate cyclase [Candidatus Wallbacteria bacterium]